MSYFLTGLIYRMRCREQNFKQMKFLSRISNTKFFKIFQYFYSKRNFMLMRLNLFSQLHVVDSEKSGEFESTKGKT